MIEEGSQFDVPVVDLKNGADPLSGNQHQLWKQLLGLAIFSVIFGYFGSPFIVIPGVFTFIDAWKSGIQKDKESKSFLNLSPMAWGIAMEGLLIITYPLYLINRKNLKKKEGSEVFFVLTILSGGIMILLFMVYVLKATRII